MKHHWKCTCPACKPTVAEVLRARRPAPPPAPRQPALLQPGRQQPAVAPSSSATPPAPPPAPADEAGARIRATAAAARELAAARARAVSDKRMSMFLALRARGVAREEAERQVEKKFPDTTTERTEP